MIYVVVSPPPFSPSQLFVADKDFVGASLFAGAWKLARPLAR
jgi:hypothetical protein